MFGAATLSISVKRGGNKNKNKKPSHKQEIKIIMMNKTHHEYDTIGGTIDGKAMIIDFLPAAFEFSLVVDNAKSHDSERHSHARRRKRLDLLSEDIESLDTSGRFHAICDCFAEFNPKPPRRFDRWVSNQSTDAKQKNDCGTSGTTAPPTLSSSQRNHNGITEPEYIRPPSLLNAGLPRRQDSEDPDTIAALMAGLDENENTPSPWSEKSSNLRDSDDEYEDDDHISKLASLQPSLTNANMPKRQESEDPEFLQVLLRSLDEK